MCVSSHPEGCRGADLSGFDYKRDGQALGQVVAQKVGNGSAFDFWNIKDNLVPATRRASEAVDGCFDGDSFCHDFSLLLSSFHPRQANCDVTRQFGRFVI
jgi:hypothetical protein